MEAAPWGHLKLHTWDTANGSHPLADGVARSVALFPDNEDLIVGRNTKAVLRLSKQLVWVSNKHFAIRRDEASGRARLRDLSSNGTWVNGERITREEERLLKPGDIIELAAIEGDAHHQVCIKFEAGDPKSGAASALVSSGQKRARALSTGSFDGAGSRGSTAVQIMGGGGNPLAANAQPSQSGSAAANVIGASAGDAAAVDAVRAKRARAERDTLIGELRRAEAEVESIREAWLADQQAQASAEASSSSLAKEAIEQAAATATATAEAAATAAAATAAESARASHEAAMDRLRAEYEAEREALIERAGDAQQQLQRALQEQTAQSDARLAAEQSASRHRATAEEATARLSKAETEREALRAEAAEARAEAARERAAAARERAAADRLRDVIRVLRATADEALGGATACQGGEVNSALDAGAKTEEQ